MAQLSDFISRIFSTDRTQGLSGGAEVVIDQDPASAFYAARLRKHRTDEDLVANPEYLWATASYQGRKGGLRAHVHAERGDGVASFTDAVIVVNQADWERARALGGDVWVERASAALGERFAQFSAREKFELLYGTRPLRFQFLADGSPEMAGQRFDLGPGEYITGLLPNVYSGPAARSRAVLAVHLNLPGVWEGYREVGQLYSDQILLTLGRHWLDNYHHPALREPGLYRLQQYPDGSLVHVISPELQDRYLVRSDSVDGGASVLTIAEWSGAPVAYLVLAVVESMTVDLSSRPDIAMPMSPGPAVSTPAVVDEVPSMDEGPAVKGPATFGLAGGNAEASGPARRPQAGAPSSSFSNRAMLSKTIVPGAIEARILTLHERGALLQKVHFSAFMDGYDVYIGAGGRVGTQVTEPKATLQVRGSRVSMVIQAPGVTVDGREPAIGKAVPLRGEVTIEVDGNKLVYRDLTDVRAEGWPYLGELRRPGAGSYLEFGQPHRVGRDRRCKVRLPDEPHNENIAWLPSVGGGTTIRSRTGDIPKSRFYTDSIMVASEHAEVDVRGEPVLRSLARHCYTFVRRGAEIVTLFPREGPGGRQEVELQPNDELLVGNCLFQVSFPPFGQAAAAAAMDLAPSVSEIPRLSPADLAAQVDEAPSGPGRATMEPPPAGGFGERGTPPRPVRLDPVYVPPREAEEPVAPLAANVPPVIEGGKPPPPMMIGNLSMYMEPPKVLEETTSNEDTLPQVPNVTDPSPARVGEDTFDPTDPVVTVEEAQWQFEVARPAQLVQVGWMASGEVVVGNHRGVGVVVPEVRAAKDQAFGSLDYFRLFVRGKRGKIELLQPTEASVKAGGASVIMTEDVDGAVLSIIRRDADLEPDFDVELRLKADPTLPDPRARLLEIDVQDRLVSALFTTGFALRSPRRVRLGPITVTAVYDGERLAISDYLASYRLESGFQPFFWREGARPYRTVPEDGSTLLLGRGDSLIAGAAVYRFAPA